jgi:hypothetical protein
MATVGARDFVLNMKWQIFNLQRFASIDNFYPQGNNNPPGTRRCFNVEIWLKKGVTSTT